MGSSSSLGLGFSKGVMLEKQGQRICAILWAFIASDGERHRFKTLTCCVHAARHAASFRLGAVQIVRRDDLKLKAIPSSLLSTCSPLT
mmetsp:Transcript_2562/g.3915  ORF Transcript_2562/g.3915 Transcript_2562/m.3915 type:complete len:88 (+) Transcript_2562:793-1056(+)